MKLDEIATRITTHLSRIEADVILNPPRRFDRDLGRWVEGDGGTRRLWLARAQRAGSRVRVSYVSYQSAANLTRAEALAYLAWLDAGNVGTHYEMPS